MSALRFLFADRSRHGVSGRGDTMGRPHRTPQAADRAGWRQYDATDGFRPGKSRRRGFLRRRT
ncbi:hypothetical protein AN218_22975 [Streptomyces nanshensis]|uniref:Uncharacterized protein n=1 Tax=Streptomyces nanshensis TaxID=518642 RepID=A0A1E7KZJ6_9ACTN|nr:hypothetical protein AN218_22975 [Streptomyces nanshensis]